MLRVGKDIPNMVNGSKYHHFHLNHFLLLEINSANNNVFEPEKFLRIQKIASIHIFTPLPEKTWPSWTSSRLLTNVSFLEVESERGTDVTTPRWTYRTPQWGAWPTWRKSILAVGKVEVKLICSCCLRRTSIAVCLGQCFESEDVSVMKLQTTAYRN